MLHRHHCQICKELKMATIIIKDEKQIEELKEGDSYVLDIFNSFDDENQMITKKQEKEKIRLVKIIEEHMFNISSSTDK